MTLSLDIIQSDRYSWHITMDEVGPEGQGRLLSSRVVIVGASGLGAPVVQYFMAADVGELVVVDDDVVKRNNPQRQAVHCDDDVGTPKAESVAALICRLNPDVSVEPVEARVDKSNVHEVTAGSDVVADVSNNFPMRYPLNSVCRFEGIPLVYDVIYKFEGQVTTFVPDGPCYRCPFPEVPEPGTVPDCATTGALGVLPGMVDCIQTVKAMKLLLDEGKAFDGRLLLYDAMDMTPEVVPYRADPDCLVCGEGGVDSIEDIDYVESRAISLD